MSTGLYAYAICRGLTEHDVADRSGIGGAPLRIVEQDGLSALVSDVDLEEFGEEGLRRNLEDLEWLRTVATAHDEVARNAAERVPTAPLRLATVFLGEESLRTRLVEWQARAVAALDRIEGRSEWSVKAYVDPAARPAPVEATAVDDGVGAGRAYLLKRRAATQQRDSAAQQDAEVAEELFAQAQGAAVASLRLALQDRRLSGHTGEMVLNGTFLVDNESVGAFREVVEGAAARHRHVRVELGGPWPPYSFSSLDGS